jgi:transcriptional regulator with XRE-family HTH domain
LREQRRISQVALAKLLNVSKLSVWIWEGQGMVPPFRTVQAVANIFGVTENLLTGNGECGSTDAEVPSSLIGTGTFEEPIAECRTTIATRLGTTPDKVEITVKL